MISSFLRKTTVVGGTTAVLGVCAISQPTPAYATNSSNVEYEEKGFLYFNSGNCVNTAVYFTPSGNRYLVGSKAYINRCRKSTGSYIGSSVRHISYFKFIGGRNAVEEIVEGVSDPRGIGLPRAQMMFAPIKFHAGTSC